MSFNKTWNDIINDNSIELFEHPIFNTLIPKEEFYREFCNVLDQLDGQTMTDYVDFYFQRDAINKSNFKFVGENEKMDFYDWAVEEGCLPELKEIQQGESQEDKRKRDQKEEELRMREEAKKIQKEKEMEKKSKITEKEKLFKILDNKWKGIIKLKNKEFLNIDKLKKAETGFFNDYSMYKSKFGEIDIYENEL